ncbi:hypothetical protein N8D56_03265 [Devosia sp. A8/3-2]|nr:hypothetical protein N8D56_03265 [Devosia sp. A8/3-2]
MPRSKTPPRVTHATAARHEALWLRLTALHAQIAAVAARRPQAPVSAGTISVAEALLRDAQVFLGLGDSLPMAAPDHGGLLTQLGRALAGLDAREAGNAEWRGELNAFVWKVVGDPALPVQRLRPKLSAATAPHADPDYAAYKARMLDLRAKLAKRIEQFHNR